VSNKIVWAKARCPVCGILYSYRKDGYKPSTCNNFDCVHRFVHHRELYEGGDASLNSTTNTTLEETSK